jgi:hypothetical protein
MPTTSLEMKVHDFLAQKRIASAGVARNNSRPPAANLRYRRLESTGHAVFLVHSHLQTFGDAAVDLSAPAKLHISLSQNHMVMWFFFFFWAIE